jgi:predicted NAD-dependent protein-ADP-ribosyltransferase YbiA (DUF1768 family)
MDDKDESPLKSNDWMKQEDVNLNNIVQVLSNGGENLLGFSLMEVRKIIKNE